MAETPRAMGRMGVENVRRIAHRSCRSFKGITARKQECLWRGYWSDGANMLEVGVSEFVDTQSVTDVSPGRTRGRCIER